MQIPTFELGDEITDEHRQALDEVGALVFKRFASPEQIAVLRDAWDALCHDFVEQGRTHVNGTPIKFGARPDGSRYVQRFAFASLFSDEIRAFVQSDRFEPVRHICGDDMRLGEDEKDGVVINCYRNEPGSRYKRLGWHTDGLRDVFLGQPLRPMYNVGLYLDDSPRAKGALRLIPGSHRQGRWSMVFRKWYFVDHSTDPDEVVLEADAGDLTIHDGRLWHRVAAAELEGEASTRRTMYLPFINGPYAPRTEKSRTPVYHRFQWITG